MGLPPAQLFLVEGEYLMWWVKDGQVPALITTGVPGDDTPTRRARAARHECAFSAATWITRGDQEAALPEACWLNDCQTVGIEGSYFFLGGRSVRFDRISRQGLGSGLMCSPFF